MKILAWMLLVVALIVGTIVSCAGCRSVGNVRLKVVNSGAGNITVVVQENDATAEMPKTVRMQGEADAVVNSPGSRTN